MKHIFGSWRDSRGNKATKGILHLKLNQDALIPATSQNAPREIEFALDNQGALKSQEAKIWANDELLPTGTYYVLTVTALGGGVIWGPVNVYVAGSDPIDLNLAIPIPGVAGIAALAAQAAETVVFTRPPLWAGVINAEVSDLTTWSPHAYVTVSESFLIAPGGDISIIASKSLDSLTATISHKSYEFNAGLGGGNIIGDTGPSTAGVYLAGGNNITLSGQSGTAGLTVTISGQPIDLHLGATGRGGVSGAAANMANVRTINFIADDNITLAGSYSNNAASIYIEGTSGGQLNLSAGSNVSIGSVTNQFGSTATIEAAQFSLAHGSNISLASHSDAHGTTATIEGSQLSIVAGPNILLSEDSNAHGTTATIAGSLLSLVPGPNITFFSTTDQYGTTATIRGGTEGMEALRLAYSQLPGGSVSGNSQASDIRTLNLVAGSNITFNVSDSGQQATISIAAGGMTAGIPGHTVSNQFLLEGGSNVTIATATDSAGMTGWIDAAALSLVQGSNITLSTATNASGTIVTIRAADAPAIPSLSFVNGSNVTVSTATNSLGMTATINAARGSMSLVEGSNISLSSGTDVWGTTATISAGGGMRSVLIHGDGGSIEGYTNDMVPDRLILFAGSNITLSAGSWQPGWDADVYINAGGGGLGLELEMGNGSAPIGPVGTASNLQLIADDNITLRSFSFGDTLGVGIAAPGRVNVGMQMQGGGQTTGNQFVYNVSSIQFIAQSNVTLSMATGGAPTGPNMANMYISAGAPRTSIVGGSNITVATSSNTAGSTITINGANTGNLGSNFYAQVSGGNQTGSFAVVSQRLALAGGSYVTLSGSTNTAGMTLTVSGNPPGIASLYAGAESNGTTSGITSWSLVSAFELRAGQNMSFSGYAAGASRGGLVLNAPNVGINQLYLYENGGSTGGGESGFSGLNRVYLNAGPNITITGYKTSDDVGAVYLGIEAASASAGRINFMTTGNMGLTSATNTAGTTATLSVADLNVQLSAVGAGSTAGMTTVARTLRLVASDNITLSGQPLGPNSLAVYISGGAGGTGAGGGGAVSLQGSNITIASTTNASGSTFGLTGATGGTGGGGDLNVGLGGAAYGGVIDGFMGVVKPNNLMFVAGSNIALSAETISQTGTASTKPDSFNLSIQAMRLSLVEGANIALETLSDAQGTTATINALGGGGGTGTASSGGGSFWVDIAGTRGGSVEGWQGPSKQELRLVAGSNITLSGSNDNNGLMVFIDAAAAGTGAGTFNGPNMGFVVGGAGSLLGNTAQLASSVSRIRFAAGSNVTLSGSTSPRDFVLTINAAAGGTGGGADFYAGISGGNTLGQTAIVNNNLMLAGGPNITLSGSTNAAGLTVSISGASGGGTGPFNVMLSGGGAGSTQGVSAAMVSGLRLQAGSNVTLSASSNTNQVLFVTVNAGSGTSGGGGISDVHLSNAGGLLDGVIDFPNIRRFGLVAGSNIMLSGVSGTSGGGWGDVHIHAEGGTGGGGFKAGLSSIPTASVAGMAYGDFGPVTNQLILIPTANLTLSGTTNTQGMTVSISAQRAPVLFPISTTDGGTASANFNWETGVADWKGGLRLIAGSNVFLSAASNSQQMLSITINVPGVEGLGHDNRYMANAWPIMPSYTTISDWQLYNQGVVFWPFQPGITGSNCNSANAFFYFNMPNSGTAYGTFDASFGIYTRNNLTLSRMSSGATSYRWSYTYGVNRTNYDNLKMIKFNMGSMSFDARDYWGAFCVHTSSSSQSYGLSVLAAQMRSGDMAGELGVATASSWQQVPGWGKVTSVNSLPASIQFSQIQGTAGTDQRAPLMYFLGFTA